MRKAVLPAILMLLTAWTSAAQLRLTVPEASPLGKTDTVSVLIGGDVMLHARQLDYGFSGFFRDVGELMKSADFTAVNMDEVVSLRMLYVNSDVSMFDMTLKYSLNRAMTTFGYLSWAVFCTAAYIVLKQLLPLM